MKPLRTVISPQPAPWKISHSTPIILMGSCFSEHIGQHLRQAGFTVHPTPFGILYNPLSIRAAVQHIVEKKFLTEDDLVYYEERYHSMLHHGSFSASTQQETLSNINDDIFFAHTFLKDDSIQVFITLGTTWVYEREGQVVGNCHRMPEATFTRRRISVEETRDALRDIVSLIHGFNPKAHIVFTVSPIRHVRDGLHENQLSKSTLLLAIDQLLKSDDHLHCRDKINYYPAYELLMDDLRDYRFYADDLCHPSPLAIEYVWDHFQQTYMTPATRNKCRIDEKAYKTEAHRKNKN